jgi:hypothetical protein
MGIGGGVAQVVDGHEVELAAVVLEHGLGDLAANAAKSVDADSQLCHFALL